MLTEMAGMSVEDGLTMQLHPGAIRNHNALVYAKFGRDKGADIPSTDGVCARAAAAAREVRERAGLHLHSVHAG